LPEPLVGAAIMNAGFMLQKYKIFWKKLGYSKNICNFARKWQSGGCSRHDVRESGESPELYLQL
jgi:hypothetical protein